MNKNHKSVKSGQEMNEMMVDKEDAILLRKIKGELEMMRWEMRAYGYPLWHELYGKDAFYNRGTDQLHA